MVFKILLVVAIGLAILFLNPITISCVGCGEGGLFHKCAEGTGRGSKTCDNLQEGEVFLNQVGQQVSEIQGRISTLKDDILEPVEKTKEALQKISEDIGEAIPSVEFTPLRAPNMPNCQIPGTNVNPCSELNSGLDTTVKAFNAALDEISKAMNFVIDEMNKVFSLILLPLQQKLQQIFTTIVSPWIDIKDDALGLVSDVQELLGSVSAIGIGNIIMSSIAARINAIFPFMSLGLALAIAGLLVLMWMLGGFFGAILMMDKFAGSLIWISLLPVKLISAIINLF